MENNRKVPILRRRKQAVILLFKILKASEKISQKLTPVLGRSGATDTLINKNLNISVFAFII